MFNNGVPWQIATTNAPVSGQNHGNYLGAYVQDSWTLARGDAQPGAPLRHDGVFAGSMPRPGLFAAQCFDEFT
jgi:hypothetical protein